MRKLDFCQLLQADLSLHLYNGNLWVIKATYSCVLDVGSIFA